MDHPQSTILILEDDPNDVVLIKRALKKNNILNPLQIMGDGVEGIDYLSGKGEYGDRIRFPFPRFIIMDLKMPRMGGLEVLQWLQDHPECQVIPTLVLSSSKLPTDIVRAYKLGAIPTWLSRGISMNYSSWCEPFTIIGPCARGRTPGN